MPINTTTERSSNLAGITAVGIDVGGERKGFHAVAITDGAYASHRSTKDVQELANWCREAMLAQVIAIDAPCRWSQVGQSRPAERMLMKRKIWCFSTPKREKAVGHHTNYFGWMLKGEQLFQELEKSHPLVVRPPVPLGQSFCFETYPHAITCRLRGDIAVASKKRVQRRELLERAGVDLTQLTNIDLVDAALCAFLAYHAAKDKDYCEIYGDEETGCIIVPKRPLN